MDLAPQYSGSDLFIHYGSPVITNSNTVLIPVKTGAYSGLSVEARRGSDGASIWTMDTDFAFAHFNWVPSMGIALTPNDSSVAIPGAGGTVLIRANPNSASGATTRLAFYGLANYSANPAAFNNAIQICTPITCDSQGNLYFGFVSTGVPLPGYPAGIPSGLARISSGGAGTFASAANISGDANMVKVTYNCAPALSTDGTAVYVAVNNTPVANAGSFGVGYLCRLSASTLVRQSSVVLRDPRGGVGIAYVTDDGSATPTVGPDGDVYFGVLEGNFPSNHDRGWLLHYSGNLLTTKLPNAFGWDDTASVVPASAVPLYSGSSSYLLLTKFNNYAGVGGDGQNKLAIVDPNAAMVDPITGAIVMKTVQTVLGPTPDPDFGGGAVREWCINAAAIDTVNRCAVVNSEDGHVYRWDFATNRLSSAFPMAPATGEAYTPTVIGPDGAVYAINNATLYAVDGSVPVDVTSRVMVTETGFIYNASTRTYDQMVTVRNISTTTLAGPISVVLSNLQGATVSNPTGRTVALTPPGRPYINLPVSSLPAGSSSFVKFKFTKLGAGSITYSARVYSGPGYR